MEFSLKAVEEIDAFIKEIAQYLKAQAVDREQCLDIALCLRESVNNAFLYGNINGKDRCVKVSCKIEAGQFCFWVYDCGDKKLEVCPKRETDVLSEHGRGLLLMQELLDEMYFEKGVVGGKLTLKH